MKIIVGRRIVQVIGAILPNSYYQVFIKDGSIYQGSAKGIVPPILNCYATPSAYTSCPIGSIQHFLVIKAFPAFLVGLMAIVGITTGRLACGWICPFGFIQDLLNKIPVPNIKLPKIFNYLKYVVLLVLVIILPFFFSETFFCKACPAGGLTGGITQMIINPPLRELAGKLFTMKMIILGVILVGTLFISRFFCRVFCPLGALLGLFNKASLFTLQLDKNKCSDCGLCKNVCPVEIDPMKTPNSPECIRCMACVEKCNFKALKFRQTILKKPETVEA